MRMMTSNRVAVLPLAALLFLGAACGGNVTRLEAYPEVLLLEHGETVMVMVDAVASDGHRFVPVQTLAFSVDDPTVLKIDKNGNAEAMSLGKTTVWANAAGKRTAIDVTVVSAGALEYLEHDDIEIGGERGVAAHGDDDDLRDVDEAAFDEAD